MDLNLSISRFIFLSSSDVTRFLRVTSLSPSTSVDPARLGNSRSPMIIIRSAKETACVHFAEYKSWICFVLNYGKSSRRMASDISLRRYGLPHVEEIIQNGAHGQRRIFCGNCYISPDFLYLRVLARTQITIPVGSYTLFRLSRRMRKLSVR